MQVKSFYYIKSDSGNKIQLTLKQLDSGPLPLIWDYLGMRAVLRAEIVANMISLMADQQKHQVRDHVCIIHWGDLQIGDSIIINHLIA